MRSLLQHIRSVREKTILALMRTQMIWGPTQLPVDGPRDLRALESVEARLRAEVSERELVNSRIEMIERLAVTADLKDDFTGSTGTVSEDSRHSSRPHLAGQRIIAI